MSRRLRTSVVDAGKNLHSGTAAQRHSGTAAHKGRGRGEGVACPAQSSGAGHPTHAPDTRSALHQSCSLLPSSASSATRSLLPNHHSEPSRPPSTGRLTPLMYAAAGESRGRRRRLPISSSAAQAARGDGRDDVGRDLIERRARLRRPSAEQLREALGVGVAGQDVVDGDAERRELDRERSWPSWRRRRGRRC
jgi:hypothetical protein